MAGIAVPSIVLSKLTKNRFSKTTDKMRVKRRGDKVASAGLTSFLGEIEPSGDKVFSSALEKLTTEVASEGVTAG